MRLGLVAALIATVLALGCAGPTASPTSDREVEATIAAAVGPTVGSTLTNPPLVRQTLVPVQGSLRAFVARVIDGDTLELSFPDEGRAHLLGFNATETVRLLGVDTPETYSANKPGEYGNIADMDCLDRWGELATEFAVHRLDQQTVNLVLDADAGLKGSYGRLLAYLSLNGQDFNARLIELGYARVYTEGSSRREQDYLRLQEVVRAQHTGLWECESESPISMATPAAVSSPTNGTSERACDPAYPSICIPSPPPDLDCGEISYRNFKVLAPDPHRFDGDKDGFGCER